MSTNYVRDLLVRGFDSCNLGLLFCEAFLKDGAGGWVSAYMRVFGLGRTRILLFAPFGGRTGDG